MNKVDYKKILNPYYAPSAKNFSLVEIPQLNYLMIDGAGDPNTTQDYKDAVEALFSLAYTIKFKLKKSGTDFAVMPLEGLWWADDMEAFTTWRNKDLWKWTMMIMQPEIVTSEIFAEAKIEAAKKKMLCALEQIRFAPYDEGLAVQILYFGAYENEGETIARMHDFAVQSGYQLHKHHHEIYLSDPRRTAPAKLKTVLRHPVI